MFSTGNTKKETKKPTGTWCCVCVPSACDDECSGLLISDMDRLYRIITDVTLTTPLPPPYKMLYRFENMTEELKVQENLAL